MGANVASLLYKLIGFGRSSPTFFVHMRLEFSIVDPM
jgi:hypothetical protein